VFDILKKKFGEVETSSLNAKAAVQAIFEGLQERYGGQSEKIQKTWSGMTESLKSYWTEFERLVMKSGVMKSLETFLAGVVDRVDKLHSEGKLQEWAKKTADEILDLAKGLVRTVGSLADIADRYLPKIITKGEELYKTFQSLPGWIQEGGVVAAIVFGKKGLAVFGAGLHLIEAVQNSVKGAQAVAAGKLSLSEYAFSNFPELKRLLSGIESTSETGGPFVRMPISQPGSYSAAAEKVVDTINSIQEAAQNASESIAQATQSTAQFFDYMAAEEGRNPFVFEPQIKKSPAKPWAVGIQEMMDDLRGVGGVIQDALDLTGVASLTASMQATIRAIRDFGPLTDVTTYRMYAGAGEKEAYGLSKQLLEAQFEVLKGVSGGAAMGRGAAGMILNFDVGSINIAGGGSEDLIRRIDEGLASAIKYGRSRILVELREAKLV
jgi:hypothetical protein